MIWHAQPLASGLSGGTGNEQIVERHALTHSVTLTGRHRSEALTPANHSHQAYRGVSPCGAGLAMQR